MVHEASEMGVSEFIETFGHVFEGSPWIAEDAWYRGLGARNDTAAGVHEAVCNQIRRASHEKKLELLRAHPELGVAMGGRELSESSRGGTRGQGAVGNLILGSVATKVLHLAKVPVTLVK